MNVAVYSGLADATAAKADNARNFHHYGGPDSPELINLRCFKYYHPDVGSWLTAPDGRDRWMGPKASRIYAILHRASSSGVGRTTMTAVASEAMASTSTVSRTVQRLQAFGFFAIDVIRGRNGGIVVRRRSAGDHLRHYAAAAWRRIRSLINVASRSQGVVIEREGSSTRKDATFTEGDSEQCRQFAEEWRPTFDRLGLSGCPCVDHTPLKPSEASRAADQEYARAQDWVQRTIIEIKRLDAGDPDWDVWLDKVRASHGL